MPLNPIILTDLPVIRFGTHTFMGGVIKENPVLIDCGAHLGNFTDFICSRLYNVTCYLYEPNECACEYLRCRFKDNDNVNIYNLGISNNGKPLTYYKSIYEPESSTYRRALRDKYHTTLQSNTTTLRKEIESCQLDWIDILKLDIEGLELSILNGLSNKIKDKLGQILIEFHIHCLDKDKRLQEWNSILRCHNKLLKHYAYAIYVCQRGEMLTKAMELEELDMNDITFLELTYVNRRLIE